jgi:hypothetical protein
MNFLPLKGLFDEFNVIIGRQAYPVDRLFLAAKSPRLKGALMLDDKHPRTINNHQLDLDSTFLKGITMTKKDADSLIKYIYEGKLEGSVANPVDVGNVLAMVASLDMTVPHRWFSKDFDVKPHVAFLRGLHENYPPLRNEIQWTLLDALLYWEIQDCLLVPLSLNEPSSGGLIGSHKCVITRTELDQIEYRLFYRNDSSLPWKSISFRSEPLMIKSCNPDENLGLRGEPVVAYYETSKPHDVLASRPLPDLILDLLSKVIGDKNWKDYIYVNTAQARDKLKLIADTFTKTDFI